MDDPASALRDAFEAAGYDVAGASVNRGQIRVVLHTEQAEAGELEDIVAATLEDTDVLGVSVSTEAIEGRDAIGTVVAIRRRP